MRNKRKRINPPSYYAKILIVVALTLLVYGAILDISNSTRLYDPIKDVETENSPVINITTVDGSEVETGNDSQQTEEETITQAENNNSSNSGNSSNNSNNINNSNNSNTNNNNINNNTNTSEQQNNQTTQTPLTVEQQLDSFRKQIESKYDIKVYYGNETSGYTVGGLTTTPITNNDVIANNLYRLNSALSLYPNGFFKEIKKGGIPLKVYLIQSYSQKGVTGVTNSDYYHADISISAEYSFEESFFHESYHYIERYMFKKGANFNTWNSLNPNGLEYGNINSNNSYSNTFQESAPFVNNYAQTSAEEDRASTFEYMMSSSKASCLNRGTTIWNKAIYMKNTIELVYNTVSPSTTEYWERYL